MNIVKNDFIPSDGYLKLHERAQVARSKKFQSEILYNTWRVSTKDKYWTKLILIFITRPITLEIAWNVLVRVYSTR